MDELVSLTRSLVALPSHEDPTAAGDRIEEWLREETSAAVSRDAVGNVLARRPAGTASGGRDRFEDDGTDDSAAGGPTLALVGHHDVVPPADEQVAEGEYVLERDGDRLAGRGTADMKGAVAAAMLAFRDADLPDRRHGGDLVFASFVGEEVGGEGARHAIEAGFGPELAIVGEGSTGYSASGVTDVAVAHKGRRASTLTATGEAAHASVPDEGTNAIGIACEAIDALERLEAPEIEVAGEAVAGSLVATEIHGGTAWNVVPDHCKITVDERTVPGERAALDRVAAIDGIEWTVDQDLPPMRCRDEDFARTVLQAARSHHSRGAPPQHVVKPHATDAGWLSQAGTACVVCGPAEPGEAHTDEESVSIPVLDRCRRIYRTVAEELLAN